MARNLVFVTGLLGVLLFTGSAIIGGAVYENYSHISQFISESYATGTEYGNALRFYGYLPSGICFFVFAILAPKYLPNSKLLKIAFWAFALFYGLGTIIVSFFPCDFGCNREFIDPSLSQIIHNLTGALTYMFVPVSIVIIGIKSMSWKMASSYPYLTLGCGILAFVGMFGLTTDPNANYIGIFQRLTEGSILLWIVTTAFQLKKKDSLSTK